MFCFKISYVKKGEQILEVFKSKVIVVEVWTKVPSSTNVSDKLIGLVKLPLTFFYTSLRDQEIAKLVFFRFDYFGAFLLTMKNVKQLYLAFGLGSNGWFLYCSLQTEIA